jgi:hypothetical protein
MDLRPMHQDNFWRCRNCRESFWWMSSQWNFQHSRGGWKLLYKEALNDLKTEVRNGSTIFPLASSGWKISCVLGLRSYSIIRVVFQVCLTVCLTAFYVIFFANDIFWFLPQQRHRLRHRFPRRSTVKSRIDSSKFILSQLTVASITIYSAFLVVYSTLILNRKLGKAAGKGGLEAGAVKGWSELPQGSDVMFLELSES